MKKTEEIREYANNRFKVFDGFNNVTNFNMVDAFFEGYDYALSRQPSAPAVVVEWTDKVDNFAISFAIWCMHDPQAQAYQAEGITAYDLLQKYKDRPYMETNDLSKQ